MVHTFSSKSKTFCTIDNYLRIKGASNADNSKHTLTKWLGGNDEAPITISEYATVAEMDAAMGKIVEYYSTHEEHDVILLDPPKA